MKKFRGFTLAEVLITLAIIGIVAAITLPSLLVNVNEKAWDAQKKALHARLAQAIGQMNTLGGYGTYTEDKSGNATEDTAAESFILDALSKVYKINNVCGAEKLDSCGIPSKVTTLGEASEINFPKKMSELNAKLFQGAHGIGETGDMVDTKVAAFETINGESVAVFYNPLCGSKETFDHYAYNKLCVNFIYDLNGGEGPNEVGKDVGFVTVLYNKNASVVSPMPYYKDYSTTVTNYSDNSETIDAANACIAMGEDLRLPNIDELSSMYINGLLINLSEEVRSYWSSSIISTGANGLAWRQGAFYGNVSQTARSAKTYVRCVKK